MSKWCCTSPLASSARFDPYSQPFSALPFFSSGFRALSFFHQRTFQPPLLVIFLKKRFYSSAFFPVPYFYYKDALRKLVKKKWANSNTCIFTKATCTYLSTKDINQEVIGSWLSSFLKRGGFPLFCFQTLCMLHRYYIAHSFFRRQQHLFQYLSFLLQTCICHLS